MLILTLDLNTEFEHETFLLTDEVIKKVGESDLEAFETLYKGTTKSIYGYALSILKNHDDAQDIMQETYLKIKASAHLYQPLGKPMAWVFTIVKNLCMLKIRSKKRFIDEELENQVIISNEISDRENRILLMAALEILDETERNIIILHAACGLKHREIASNIGLNISTVLSKYHRGLKKLKNHLNSLEEYHEYK